METKANQFLLQKSLAIDNQRFKVIPIVSIEISKTGYIPVG